MTFALESNVANDVRECLRAYDDVDILSDINNEQAQKAAEALLFSLKHFGKNANLKPFSFVSQAALPKQFPADKNRDRADFLISIKEGGTKLAQLFYEKTESGLNLFLKTKGRALKKEDIILQPLKAEKLLICVGLPSLDYSTGNNAFYNYFVLNIDNNNQNKHFGDINMVYPGEQLEIIVFSLIKEIVRDFWQNQFVSQAYQNESGHKEKPLLLRVVSRLMWKPQKELLFCPLSLMDFRVTGTTAKNLAFVLKQIVNGPFLFQRFLLLWEQNSSPLTVKGVFFARYKDDVFAVLSQRFASQAHTNACALLFDTGYSTLTQAEKEIANFL